MDGDFDWFVTSIWDPHGVVEGQWDTTGTRLYRNRSDGTFQDVTEAPGGGRGCLRSGATCRGPAAVPPPSSPPRGRKIDGKDGIF